VDFTNVRAELHQGFLHETNWDLFDWMEESTRVVEQFLLNQWQIGESSRVWVGGSIGRREFLANSDLDFFVLDEGPNLVSPMGFDKVECGALPFSTFSSYLRTHLIDGNRIIDGRPLAPGSLDRFETFAMDLNTEDRQVANLVSEYFFYSLFDFARKTTIHGENIKYSRGSSRYSLLLNFCYRIQTGNLPQHLRAESELRLSVESLFAGSELTEVNWALSVVFTCKASAAGLKGTNGAQVLYYSDLTLDAIFSCARRRLASLDIRSETGFRDALAQARAIVESRTSRVVEQTLAEHSAQRGLPWRSPEGSRGAYDTLIEHSAGLERSDTALLGWQACLGATSQDLLGLAKLVESLELRISYPLVMALLCSRNCTDEIRSTLLTSVANESDPSPYLVKMIRDGSTAEALRNEAGVAYLKYERFL
jgi:hypothetical protein